MRVRAYIWLLLAEVILSIVIGVLADESESDEFVATREWQEVKPGQHIPAGLHVRMDLEKGGRWAKLMEDEGKGEKSISAVEISDEVKNVPVTRAVDDLDIAELKIALKKLKNEQVLDEQQKNEEDIAGKFRSMDEIKEAFDELHLQEETDFEVMQRLLKKYHQEETSLEEKILILKDLEIYVHQVDNAVDFIKLTGLQTMVAELNSTENRVRAEAAHVIGSAVQSNPAVQIKTVESGALSLLVRIITNTKETEETRKKALYAVSCLIRRLPAAQYMFRNVGGFSALATCIHEHGSEKLQYKAISLLNDLIVERNEQILIEEPNQNDKERERQLKLFVLSDEIQQLGICTTIINLLKTNEHDQREILITFMEHAHEICHNAPHYKTEVYSALQRYEKEYKNLADEEELEGDYDSYFHVMHTSVVDLMQLMEDENAGFDHDEL